MKRGELIENVIMILCIPALWPVVRVMRGVGSLPDHYEFFLGFAALVLIAIAVRRIRRLSAAFRDTGRRPRSPH